MIPVTKPYMPNREKLNKYLDGIYEREWLSNNGQLVQELTHRLEEYLEVENLLLVANGTLALQVAYRALGLNDAAIIERPEVITTPFTFIATASSMKWVGMEPVFVDIDPDTWCIDPDKIEAFIDENTRAIVPVHVFGTPCDVENINRIADLHNLKVIYDASHAFGVKYRGESILRCGDASTLSFHATKLFHTAEGGGIVFKNKEDFERAKKIINFGISSPDMIDELGINAKMSELQAAMGLCVLDEIEDNIRSRKKVLDYYKDSLPEEIKWQKKVMQASQNYSYIPVLLKSENDAVELVKALKDVGVTARRYFFPSLNELDIDWKYNVHLETSHDISSRIVCLPIYSGILLENINKIIKVVKCYF